MASHISHYSILKVTNLIDELPFKNLFYLHSPHFLSEVFYFIFSYNIRCKTFYKYYFFIEGFTK